LDIQVTPGALGLVVGQPAAAELPGETWQPIAAHTPAELGNGGDFADAIRHAGKAPGKRRRNSPPEIPPTGLNPRRVEPPAPPPPPPDDEPLVLSDAQMRKLRALYKTLGVVGAGEQKRISALLLGVDRVATHSALTVEHATRLIDRLTALEAGFLEFVIDENAIVIGVRDALPPTGPDHDDAQLELGQENNQ
jgi:hypothetical protein